MNSFTGSYLQNQILDKKLVYDCEDQFSVRCLNLCLKLQLQLLNGIRHKKRQLYGLTISMFPNFKRYLRQIVTSHRKTVFTIITWFLCRI